MGVNNPESITFAIGSASLVLNRDGTIDLTGAVDLGLSDLTVDDLTVNDDAVVTGDLTVTAVTTLNGDVALGNAAGDLLGFHGHAGADQAAAIADAAGGATVDAEARTAINAVLAALRETGYIAT